MSATEPEISFREISDEGDADFLYRLYASTRKEEIDQVIDWDDAQKEAFLRQQFEAQTTFYNDNFREGSDFHLILIDGEAQGRVYLDRRDDEFRIIDIALLPEMRGKGIGGRIMRDIISEANEAGKPVCIHVERNNPAMHLYERLGFKQIEEQGVYYLMERPVGPLESAETA